MTASRLAALGVTMEVCYLSFYVMEDGAGEVLLFLGVGLAAFALFAYAVYLLRASGRLLASGDQLLIMIISFAVLFRLTLVFHDPIASDDIYRYVWDGKVAASGINPFAFAPDDARLNHLHTADLPAKINFTHMRTIYPPVAQVFFQVSYLLFGDSVAGMKLLLVAVDVASIMLLVILLRRWELLPETVLLYAWSPLPVLYFALEGHVDALAISFFILCLLLAGTGWHALPDATTRTFRHMASGLALGASVLAKILPLLVLPFLLRGEGGRWRLGGAAATVALVGLGSLLYLEGSGGLYESLLVFAHEWSFNGSLFKILHFLVGSDMIARTVSGIALLAWVLGLVLIKRPFPEKVFLAFLGWVVVAPVVHPWYLCWLAALLVVRWSLPAFILLGSSFLSTIVVYLYRTTGVWEDQLLVLLAEYLPFYILLVREIVKGTFSPAPPQVTLL